MIFGPGFTLVQDIWAVFALAVNIFELVLPSPMKFGHYAMADVAWARFYFGR